MATRAGPDIDVRSQGHPGDQLKVRGNTGKMRRIDAAADLVIGGVNRLAIVVNGERAGADPAHCSFGRAVREKLNASILSTHRSPAAGTRCPATKSEPPLPPACWPALA